MAYLAVEIFHWISHVESVEPGCCGENGWTGTVKGKRHSWHQNWRRTVQVTILGEKEIRRLSLGHRTPFQVNNLWGWLEVLIVETTIDCSWTCSGESKYLVKFDIGEIREAGLRWDPVHQLTIGFLRCELIHGSSAQISFEYLRRDIFVRTVGYKYRKTAG